MRVEKKRNTCLIDKVSQAFFAHHSTFRNIVKTLFPPKPESNRAKFSPIKDAELIKAEINYTILLDKTNTLVAVLLSQ